MCAIRTATGIVGRAVVVMDNLRVHKVEGVEKMMGLGGAKVVYLSPYSP
jgi:transposase